MLNVCRQEGGETPQRGQRSVCFGGKVSLNVDDGNLIHSLS